MTQKEVRIALKNRLADMHRLCDYVQQIGKQHNFANKKVLELNLILEEIVANIINHGYNDEEEHQIDILFSIDGNAVTIDLYDDGIPFNPMHAPVPDISTPMDQRAIGGLGMVFIHKFSDHVDYRRQDNKNRVTISKKMV